MKIEEIFMLVLLFMFIIMFYLTYANYEMKQQVIYVDRDVTPEVIIKEVQMPCNISDYNFKCEHEIKESNQYLTNVFPSEQCKGVKVSEMLVVPIPHRTGSMRPTIYAGDTLLITKYDPKKKLVLGDIVGNKHYLHRIVAVYDETKQYWTKGDNNREKDFLTYNFDDTEWIVCGVLRATE